MAKVSTPATSPSAQGVKHELDTEGNVWLQQRYVHPASDNTVLGITTKYAMDSLLVMPQNTLTLLQMTLFDERMVNMP